MLGQGHFENNMVLSQYLILIYSFFMIKAFNFLAHLLTIMVAIASIAHIEFPYRKPLLYVLLAYVLVVDFLIPLIRKKV